MEQNHVYLDLNSYNSLRLIQQNSEDQMVHQQQLTSLMSPNQVSRDLIVQGDQVLYSSLKPNEQYITQQDESMQGQYLIQSPQQVFYTNVNSQNQNRIQNPHQQTITLNQNIISQQNEAKVNDYFSLLQICILNLRLSFFRNFSWFCNLQKLLYREMLIFCSLELT